jgi:hypothetical protein
MSVVASRQAHSSHGPIVSSDAPELFHLLAATTSFNYANAMRRLRHYPHEGRYVDHATNMTALHLAVLQRTALVEPEQRIKLVAALLTLHPEATNLRCCGLGNQFTPLDCACFIPNSNNATTNSLDEASLLQADAKIIELLVRSNPSTANAVYNTFRSSPLSLHIQSMSRIQATTSTNKREAALHRASKSILNALTVSCSLPTLTRALETLYECNTTLVMDMLARETSRTLAHANNCVRTAAASTCSQQPSLSNSTNNNAQHWIWECFLTLLAVMQNHLEPSSQTHAFRAVHIASQVPDCPPPFLLLACKAYPYDVARPDERTGNLPLHGVAGWKIANGYSAIRKAICVTELLTEYDDALDIVNASGRTPVDLDKESGTTLLAEYDNGVRLVQQGTSDEHPTSDDEYDCELGESYEEPTTMVETK